MRKARCALIALLLCSAAGLSQNAPPDVKTPPLRLVQVIPLPDVQGRIDHLTVDVKRRRVILSGLGNDTVEVVDAFAGKRIRTIKGLSQPQGVVYAPEVDRLFVANSVSGVVNMYDGATFELKGVVDFGDNADNLRYDAESKRLYVAYGDGAIGAIDVTTGRRMEVDLKLTAHPESFQFEKKGPRIFVNVADEKLIAVIDRKTGVIAKWPLANASNNFPMLLDETNDRLLIGTRNPSRLKILDTSTGKEIASLPAAADMDDLIFDAQRKRIYLTGGEGTISVYRQVDSYHYDLIGTVGSRVGARTATFFAERDRLFVAVPATGDQMAALWVYAPQD